MTDYEKLGAFYLGRVADPQTGKPGDEPLLYDSRDLTTHGVIVGMTGSGKTGLAIALLEEAAIDGIPAIAIDPKGDLGNLLLQFPEMRAEDFLPWVDPGEASRAGLDPAAYAAKTAEAWRKGLADWGQDPSRIDRLRAACDLAVFTPGSASGAPLSVLRSLDAPARALRDDPDALRDRVGGAVSGLLGLLGIDADPVRSREHILLSRVLEEAWSKGEGLDLGRLVLAIQRPPFERVGVLDVESFYPAKERAGLALQLNNLLASPGFAAWAEGPPLDVAKLLWTSEGKPRISVLSIAHLSDAERMFFVTFLLNEVVAWMRGQPGTTSLRALLYMDEVFGYFPPVANPPSKTPMLTILKQARAFGLGAVLATQNPVDLDYKGLSNAGTWFLGRLQTERDKARVLDGLEGATAAAGKSFDRSRYDALLSGLGKRTFLMNNVHEDVPEIFQTRWVLSYLRGPLTKVEVQRLAKPEAVPSAPAPATPVAPGRPAVPADVPEFFLGSGSRLVPRVLGRARLHYVDAKAGVDHWEDVALLGPVPEDAGSPWDEAKLLDDPKPALGKDAPEGAAWGELPSAATRAKSFVVWGKALEDHLYRTRKLVVPSCPELKLVAGPGETEAAFRARVQLSARERRDEGVAALRKKYAAKISAAQGRVDRAEEKVAREQSQYDQQKVQTAISFGATMLGALFGRKVASAANVGRAATAARGVGRAARERGDVGRAQESLEQIRGQLADLEFELQQEIEALGSTEPTVETAEIAPRKSDILAEPAVLVWVPA